MTTARQQVSQADELVGSQTKFLERLEKIFIYQILGNLDQLEEIVRSIQCSDEDKKRLLILIEDAIKTPIRSQRGNVRSQLQLMRECSLKLKKAEHICSQGELQ